MLEVFWITPVSSPGEAKLCKDLITDVIMGDHMRQTAGSIQILLGISVCTATIAVVICYIWILLGINIDSPSIRNAFDRFPLPVAFRKQNAEVLLCSMEL